MSERAPEVPPPALRSAWVVCLAPLLGPLALTGWWRRGLGLCAVALALVVLQLGAVVLWLALGVIRRDPRRSAVPHKLLAGLLLYGALWGWVAPAVGALGGREPLPCFTGPLRPQSVFFCAANRHYVRPELARAALRAAERVARDHPGTVVRYLDGGFPLGVGMPMVPHLTHGDGRRLDLALLWQHADGSPARSSGSPLGYFGYVQPPEGGAACAPALLDLRWDLAPLQPLLARNDLDEARTRALLSELLAEPAVGKVLLEPHVRRRLGLGDARLRFQGCGAARHDDHVHIQL